MQNNSFFYYLKLKLSIQKKQKPKCIQKTLLIWIQLFEFLSKKQVQHNALHFDNLNYHVDEKKFKYFFLQLQWDNWNGMMVGVCTINV